MAIFVFDSHMEILEQMKPAFDEPDGMFRSNADHQNMVVEDTVLRQVMFRAFVGCNNPNTYLV